MLIKKSWETIAKRKSFSYQIVERYRSGKGRYPKTRVLANLRKFPLPSLEGSPQQ